MTYVMSDIHGNIGRYQKMLDLVGFTGDDHLYIIGDVIDRYPWGVEILLDIMEHPNVTLLMGNHEQMCLDVMYSDHPEANARNLWQFNKGHATKRFLKLLSDDERA